MASRENQDANSASKTASYERRADDWKLQCNLAARELMQIGRQLLSSLISEQMAHHEYLNIQKQIDYSQEVYSFLQEKYTNEELYAWMQGETSRLFYEYYRFAFDTARKAEQTMKYELKRPEVDATDYIKFNYWDGGRKGLLSGEALYLDLKRMEMAYHEQNKREFELTKHVSLRQLNPLQLLSLKTKGVCEVTLPEWLFDLDCPGHYMRRIKTVSLSIPSVAGPYTSVNCTLSLMKSSVRVSSLATDYGNESDEDPNIIHYYGSVQNIVTSSGNNDSGLFETNLHDERFLPFEGAGAISTWRLELPNDYRQFDYNTITDVILHIRYTARQGGETLRKPAVDHLRTLLADANRSDLAVLLSLQHDFSNEWYRFTIGSENFKVDIKQEFFPYIVQSKKIKITEIQLCPIQSEPITLQGIDMDDISNKLNSSGGFELSLAPIDGILERKQKANVFILLKYQVE